jgi:phage terminase small subunit
MAQLNAKQKKFVDEYVRSRNATQSAINAGYSSATAHVQGPRLLGNVSVKAELDKRLAHVRDESQVTVKNVINELAKGAFAELPIEEMKWSDKLKCLEVLSKYLGLMDGIGAPKDNRDNAKTRLLELVGRLSSH